jgi:hypothetical protein
MPQHHFTTPRVVYLGLAYAEKPARDASAAARSRPADSRRVPERVARRRTGAAPASATLR